MGIRRQSIVAWALAAVGSVFGLQSARCQQQNQASVEELTAILQAIDPYRPAKEVVGTVRVYGSTSMDALAHGWAGGFKQFHPRAVIEISGTGSEETFDRLQSAPDSVAMLSRPITEAELAERWECSSMPRIPSRRSPVNSSVASSPWTVPRMA